MANTQKPYSIIRRLIIGLTVTIGIVSIIASGMVAMIATRKGRIDLENEADKSSWACGVAVARLCAVFVRSESIAVRANAATDG